MSHEIFMPALSSTMTEGKIVEWLKNPGDKVERGESVLVVESDKADMDVESFQDGYLAAVLMPAGSTAPVGETIGIIVENEDEIASVQEQVSQVQQQVAAKRNEIEEQKRNLLQQQSQVRELKMNEIVDQGQVDSFCDVSVGDNLIEKMQVSITVKDGVIQSIDNN